jgi:hypothetical protein
VEVVAMKAIAPMIACGLAAASIPLAGTASAVCDSRECVPNVARDVAQGGPCAPRKTFVFGLDAGGATYVCTVAGVWSPVGPLVGVRNVPLSCPALNLSAQGSDGVPFWCVDMGGGALQWAHRPDTVG